MKKIKKILSDNPEYIVNILNSYDFYKPFIRGSEIRFGYGDGHNPTAIRLKLSETLWTTDYVRDISCDLFEYIIKTRHVTFSDVLSAVKKELGISCLSYGVKKKSGIFGGLYDGIKARDKDAAAFKVYDESILDSYVQVPTIRFLRDHINTEAHDVFNIRYDIEGQRIIIPIYNQFGELVGVKSRANYEVSDSEPKYYYYVPTPVSNILYGYSQNYEYLSDDSILVFEAEKSVMQCYSYGIRNAVALCGNSLSDIQCRLILERNPKTVIFLLDKGLDFDVTAKNAQKILHFSKLSDVKVKYWETELSELPDKSSPSDYGKQVLENILKNEVLDYETEMEHSDGLSEDEY